MCLHFLAVRSVGSDGGVTDGWILLLLLVLALSAPVYVLVRAWYMLGFSLTLI